MKISLIVPVKNEETSLPLLVDSIRLQTLPPAEIILVDGGSDDHTLEIARSIAEKDRRYTIIELPEATPGKGRNIGAEYATNEWIAFTDAGITLEPDWLEKLVDVLNRHQEVEVIYGNYEPLVRTYFEKCAAIAYVAPKSRIGDGRVRGRFIASSLMRRYVWDDVGGFPDLRAAEDLIFMEKIDSLGFATAYSPEATVWWQLQGTLLKTFRRFALYSRCAVKAGRQNDWHYGVVRQYIIGLMFLGLSIVHSFWWLAILPLGLLARAGKRIWRYGEGEGKEWTLNPVTILYVAFLLLAIDSAMFVGWLRALRVKDEHLRQDSDLR